MPENGMHACAWDARKYRMRVHVMLGSNKCMCMGHPCTAYTISLIIRTWDENRYINLCICLYSELKFDTNVKKSFCSNLIM